MAETAQGWHRDAMARAFQRAIGIVVSNARPKPTATITATQDGETIAVLADGKRIGWVRPDAGGFEVGNG